jgi:hypothetical protein
MENDEVEQMEINKSDRRKRGVIDHWPFERVCLVVGKTDGKIIHSFCNTFPFLMAGRYRNFCFEVDY